MQARFAALTAMQPLQEMTDTPSPGIHQFTDLSESFLPAAQQVLQDGSALELQVREWKKLKCRLKPQEFVRRRRAMGLLCQDARRAHLRTQRVQMALEEAAEKAHPDLLRTLQLFRRMVALHCQRLRLLSHEAKYLAGEAHSLERSPAFALASSLAAVLEVPTPSAIPAFDFGLPSLHLFTRLRLTLQAIFWPLIHAAQRGANRFYQWLMYPLIDTGDPSEPRAMSNER
jgi:hypothetical protein